MRLFTAANTIKTTAKGMESQNIWQLTLPLQKLQNYKSHKKYLTICIIHNNVKKH